MQPSKWRNCVSTCTDEQLGKLLTLRFTFGQTKLILTIEALAEVSTRHVLVKEHQIWWFMTVSHERHKVFVVDRGEQSNLFAAVITTM